MSGEPTDETPAGIDAVNVTAWFADNVPAAVAPLTFDRVAGGHSCLTYVVTDAAATRFVLRRPPLGHVLATAHDVAREHHIMGGLADTPVPVPRMLGVCTDASVNDAAFYVMSHVDGTVLHDRALVDDALPTDAERVQLSDHVVDVLVALHAVDVDAVGLSDMARSTSYLERQLKRWSAQWEASKTRELPGMERLHAWLVERRPEERETTIVHGDYRLGNMIVGPDATTGAANVRAILDWELCTLGDPLADLSYLLRSWTPPEDPPGLNLDPPTRAGGFASHAELVARYADLSGRDVSDLSYWMAFNAWRSAAIGEGVYRRYIDGKMGAMPDDVEAFGQSVERGVEAGLVAAGLD